MKILTLDEIRAVLPALDLVAAIEEGFVAYSAGRAVVPPVGELLLEGGDVHIKYGYLRDGDYYVVKIASGFYGNPSLGLPSGNGMMLLFRQATGEPVCVLLDEAHLTDVRTAVAGAIAARLLAPSRVRRIGVVGTGTQARLQLVHLETITACREVLAWGRSVASLDGYRAAMEERGFRVETTLDSAEILPRCDLVVTVTPSEEPLLTVDGLHAGTHVTAVGSDTPAKHELDPRILARADLVVADSIEQCLERGEIHQALEAGLIREEGLVELGAVIAGDAPGRTAEDQITVADLTGVAVQDIQIAAAVYRAATGAG